MAAARVFAYTRPLVIALSASSLLAQPATPPATPPAPSGSPGAPSGPLPPPAPAERPILDQLRDEAKALRPLCASPVAQRFLDATAALPDPGARVVWRTADRAKAYSQREYDVLSEAQRAGLTTRECTARFYYTTAFGSPLIYARPLQIAADHGFKPEGAKVLDFGYGLIGHLRLLASLGADAHGVDVEPLFRALYASPDDTGEIKGFAPVGQPASPDGRLTIHHGRWPAHTSVTDKIGDGYDLLISKNVLKRSYIHPERPVDEKFLVRLGVDDETFIANMHRALKPGGLVLIYNISPAQNPPDKPYLPHADPRCPFAREVLKKAGFEVLKFDEDDSAACHEMWMALGYTEPDQAAELKATLFAKYTLLKRR